MRRYWHRIWESIERQKAGGSESNDAEDAALPTIWLLGKTGAGKSSLIRLLTGATEIEIGNGYEPCTTHAQLYRFPQDAPVLQFMDTRGIGERGYDPASDLEAHSGISSAILAVARIDDPAQGELCSAVRAIRRSRPGRRIIIVHSWVDAIADRGKREHAGSVNRLAIEQAAGRRLPQLEFDSGDLASIDECRDRILRLLEEDLPLAAFLIRSEEHGTSERQVFSEVRTRVARHSLLAGSSAIVPMVGSATVLAIQGRMLVELARHYDISLDRRALAGLGSALGAGFIARQAGIQLARQAGTAIPVFGQTAGAVIAGATAFASTFALGRATGYYLYQLKAGKPPSRKEIRRLYKAALRDARRSYKPDG